MAGDAWMTATPAPEPRWRWRAVDDRGGRTGGVAEAPSIGALSRILAARGLVLVDAQPSTARGPRGTPSGGAARRALLEATRALASLLGAGVPLARALGTVARITGPPLGDVLQQVRERVLHGDPLAAALATHPRVFSPLYVGVVRAGERSGDLEGAFTTLGVHLEREAALRGRLVSAALYPLVLVVAGGTALVVLLTFVLPQFVDLLQASHTTLPRSTALLMSASAALRRGWPLLVTLAGAAAGGLVWLRRTPHGARTLAAIALRVPLIGAVRRDVLGARFARLMAALLAGGAPLLAALDDAADSIADPVAGDEVRRIRDRVREGSSLHAAIGDGRVFPPLLAQLVAIGEESGTLRDFLARGAGICDERAERTLQRLVVLVEPALILGFGVAVAFVALAVLQAIYGVGVGV